MFLALAGLVARRKGIHELVHIAENGQMAIHLPLTAARISAFSTYTAHPEFLNEMQLFLTEILNYPITIVNPYLYLTKSEVIKHIVQADPAVVGETISCWKSSRVPGSLNHCGICIPCLIRRIALEYNGLALSEYREDLLQKNVSELSPDHEGKRNLAELGEFIKLFETIHSQAELEGSYPELVSDYFDGNQAIKMYKRFVLEARTVFNRYPNIIKFLE